MRSMSTLGRGWLYSISQCPYVIYHLIVVYLFGDLIEANRISHTDDPLLVIRSLRQWAIRFITRQLVRFSPRMLLFKNVMVSEQDNHITQSVQIEIDGTSRQNLHRVCPNTDHTLPTNATTPGIHQRCSSRHVCNQEWHIALTASKELKSKSSDPEKKNWTTMWSKGISISGQFLT